MRDDDRRAFAAVMVGMDGHVVAVISLADQPKARVRGGRRAVGGGRSFFSGGGGCGAQREAASVVRALRSMGIAVHMVTGDNRRTAVHVAQRLGTLCLA